MHYLFIKYLIGTSACPNSYFYCENEGHLPAYIKSWAVNDGVCGNNNKKKKEEEYLNIKDK